MRNRQIALVCAFCALANNVQAQAPCDSSAQARVQRLREYITSDWDRALSEATLLLNMRSVGSECARLELVPVIAVRQTRGVQALLINVARSDPDQRVRTSAVQQLAMVTTSTPELRRFLDELPLRLPIREGHVGVIVLHGVVSELGGAPIAGVPATVILAGAGCRGSLLLAIRTVTESDGRYEVAFNRGEATGPVCLELTVGVSTARTEMTAVQTGAMVRTDSVRLNLTVGGY